MFKYILQRIFLAIIALIIISFFVYVLVAAFAPDPSQALAQKRLDAGGSRGESLDSIIQKIQIENSLSRYPENAPDGKALQPIPIVVRYFNYLDRIFHGDFGMPIDPDNNPNPDIYTTMFKLFFIPLRYTLIISVPALIFSLFGGIAIGVFAGYKRGKLFDSISNVIVLIFVAVPSFILAPLFISIGVKLGISPVVKDLDRYSFSTVFVSYLPPIIVITLTSLSAYVISTRNMVVTVLTSNYILIAKTKGLSAPQIFFKYVLRNISIPLFGLIFGSLLGLLSGSVIIEQYWNVPGTSQVIVNSFSTGEINVIMFSTLFFTLIGLIAAILTDVAYVILDPKITYSSKSKRNYSLFLRSYLERRKLAKELFAAQKQAESEVANG
ncbi:Oligopeptide transport system permease protein OppB [Mycoplasmopsis meleagridis]|uniref:Oligopeptide transport system permease protein OppB n=1 Tax=Mycoplasmopsis meleagridis ATCC 25294 TaxID=1264554 RepID=A0A0F5H0I7_9BACT|nr:ABC transporter permease [Mycoplasmopsis meleagridis]KKB26836.1 Oligopeptide transport system permease protein OppB [Mycoplasmopsis meleagridis ATCC 25294]KUH47383.1 peptide ABC transporter permease [Mycoplasmopsis meleagridis]OAD18571.1 Oligopeptide transport system permease protein OppB [Mycoplasmopsis meleagridis]VEU77425.1 oligopeptide ABC transporter permease [Mycoplasmopsis meleagridis]